jgi:hypothetical protein
LSRQLPTASRHRLHLCYPYVPRKDGTDCDFEPINRTRVARLKGVAEGAGS